MTKKSREILMDLEGLPEEILRKHPEVITIAQAIADHGAGRPITSRCPKCGQVLRVGEVKLDQTTETWVDCPKGCTRYHEVMDSASQFKRQST
jgi:hypothetical protein